MSPCGNGPGISAQNPQKPVVTLAGVSPSPVREGGRITITVSISPPLPADSRETASGGVIVWDSAKGSLADALIAFVFRAGQTTRSMGYTVEEDQEFTPAGPSGSRSTRCSTTTPPGLRPRRQ